MAHAPPLSENIEEYLEAIHRLSQLPRGASTSGLARHLSVTPASVTGMLRRLTSLGLITYRRYGDITLTPEGERRAHELIRRHRLAERLLTDLVAVPLEEAHAEACRLEHAVSAELQARLVAALGSPESCPHGHPIDAETPDDSIALVDAHLDEELTVSRLEDESAEVVRYLADRGILPGASLELKLREPLGGAVALSVAGKTHTLGRQLASTIRVRKPGGRK